MADSIQCNICEADFRPKNLTDGKCALCVKLYPNAKNKREAQLEHQPPNKMGDELDETKVEDMIVKMLDQRLNPLIEKMDKVLAAPAEPKSAEPKRGPGRPPKKVNDSVTKETN